MNDFTKKFFEKHEDWVNRNSEYLESSKWYEAPAYKEDAEKNIVKKATSSTESKKAAVDNDRAIIKNLVGRLGYFVKNTPGEKHLEGNKKVVKFILDTILIFISHCDSYLQDNPIIKIENEFVKNIEIKFQDIIFNAKVGVEDSLDALGVFQEHEEVKIKFYKDDKASLVLKEPLDLLKADVKIITSRLNIDWNICNSQEMFINMKPKDIPPWNPKKHFFEQELSTIQFWTEELNKITNGFTVGGYFIHPWMYFHLNYFKTPIPQQDGSEPTIQPDLRDNEWFFAENLKNCINPENPAYYSKAMLVYGTRRFAKALRNDQDLYYTDGSIRPIGLAREGDEIFGANGLPTKILGVYPQGKLELYAVELGDGRKSICCDEHLWTVYDYQAKKYKVLPLKELINEGVSYNRNRIIDKKNGVSTIYKYFLPINSPVEYKQDIKLNIDPYYLGLWLGDGALRTPSITTEDPEIIAYIEKYSNKLGLRTRIEETKANAVVVHSVGTKKKLNVLFGNIRDFALNEQKYIPAIYKTASVKDRLALLQGLMDTDGTINKGGSDISYCSADKILAFDVLELSRSLGIHSRIKKFTGNYIKENGEFNEYYKVIMYTQIPVFRLKRKLSRLDYNNINRLGKIERVPIINIKKVDSDYATCIRVDNREKEFLTNDYIVTHNSVIMASLAHWRTLTKFNSFGSIVGGNSSDLNALTSKVKTSMTYIEDAFRLDMINQNWDNGETTFGIKENISKSIIYSTLIVQNLQDGAKSKTQRTAGLAPSVSIYDEIGKYKFLKPYLAALPSFKTPYGFKCITVLAGTGGEADLSIDAMEVLNNPVDYDLLPMDWDLLESKIDPERITWKRRQFATFFPGQMAYEEGFIKRKKPFSEFLGVKNKILKDMTIHITDWEKNEKLLFGKIESAKKMKSSKGNLLEQQRKVQYPTDPEDCFITIEGNPFMSPEIKVHKERIMATGDIGMPVWLVKDANGIITDTPAADAPMAPFPFTGGFVDSPIVLFEALPETPPPFGLYVASLDDYKHEQSEGDSVGSFTIYKRNWMDKYSMTIVATYAARPNPQSKFHRQGYFLLKAFNAVCFPENEDMNFKTYLDKVHETDVFLMKGLDFASQFNLNNNGNRAFGWNPTVKNIAFGLGLAINYTEEVIQTKNEEGAEVTIMGFQRIKDVGLLEEMQNYTKEGNFDRLRSFMGALMYAHYLDTIFMTPKPPVSEEEKLKKRIKAKLKQRQRDSPYRKSMGSAYRK